MSTIRHQRAIYYPADLTEDGSMAIPKPFAELYTHMFIEDVSLGIMPIGGRSSRSDFKVTTLAQQQGVEAMIVSAISRENVREGLASGLSECFRMIASEVCAFDRATYEIAYFEDSVSKTLTGFELIFVPESQIRRKQKQIYQYVPRSVARQRKVSELICLTEQDLLVFAAPEEYRRALRNIRSNL